MTLPLGATLDCGLTKNGLGTLTLAPVAGPNIYTGPTSVNLGVLAAGGTSIDDLGKIDIVGGWASAFTLPALSPSGPTANADSDGLENSVEYVKGGDPRVSSQVGTPTSSAAGVDVVENGAAPDAITIIIPDTGTAAKFARLTVVTTPCPPNSQPPPRSVRGEGSGFSGRGKIIPRGDCCQALPRLFSSTATS